MKVYIATNKDNKDALMHYGVKGMRWGKRGGMSKNPEDYSDTQSTRRGNPKDKYDGRYGLGHQRIAVARQRVGSEWTYKQVSPGKISRRKNVSAGSRDNGNKISNGDRDATYAWQRRNYEKQIARKDRDGYRLSGKGEIKADDRWFRHLVDDQKRDYKQDELAKRYHRLAKDLEWQQKNQNRQDRKNMWNMDLGVYPGPNASANMDKKMQKVGDLLKRKKANKRR